MISSSSSSSSSARFFRFPPPPPRGVPSGAVAERDFAAKPRCVSKSASPMVFVSVSLSWRSCATRPSSSPGPAVSTLCVLPRRVASTTNADHAVFPSRQSEVRPGQLYQLESLQCVAPCSCPCSQAAIRTTRSSAICLDLVALSISRDQARNRVVSSRQGTYKAVAWRLRLPSVSAICPMALSTLRAWVCACPL